MEEPPQQPPEQPPESPELPDPPELQPEPKAEAGAPEPERPPAEPEPPAEPKRSGRKPPPTPDEAVRRLRSMLPVSPLSWHWSRRVRRGALVAIVVLVVGGAVASVLLQGDDSSSERPALGADVSAQVRRLVGEMTPAQKADAVILAEPSKLGKAPVGGVLITPESWPGAVKGRNLTSKLHSSRGRIPPLVAAQQEGGDYRALTDLPPSENELEIGVAADPPAAEAWALETGKALRAAGIDLNLAPVADVATLDSPIADRAFGDDPAVVSELTAAAVRGCAKSGVACAVSHFPGLGGASDDTLDGPATVGLDASSLAARDLGPFRAAIAGKVPAIILSLALYAGYDPVTPGALSPAVTEDLLRDDLGFKGVALTDDLSSGAIAAGQGAPEAAEAALAAGADMVVVSDPAEAKQVREALQKAAREGSLPSDRLDQAVARVLELKRRLGLL